VPKQPEKTGGRVLVVTPTTIEWEAMRGKISHTKRADEDSPAVRGTIGSFDVLCAMPGKGPGATTAVTMQLIERYAPRYVLLVGVAGGMGGVRRGDLVVPTAVHDLDYGKVEAGEFRRRKEYDWTADHKLLQYAQLVGESATNKWRNRISNTARQEDLRRL
jgi:nucleoside phosphorylase